MLKLPFNADLNNQLLESAKAGDLDSVKQVLKDGAYIHARGEQDLTALMIAAEAGQREIAEFLLQSGADPNAVDHEGYSVLYYAIWSGDAGIVKLLTDWGADIERRPSLGNEVILEMGDAGEPHEWTRWEVNEAVGKAGGGSTISDSETPLIAAARKGNPETVELLLRRGANIKARDSRGSTALIDAARNGHFDAVKVLLSYGAEVNAVAYISHATALRGAISKGNTAMVEYLLKQGAIMEKSKAGEVSSDRDALSGAIFEIYRASNRKFGGDEAKLAAALETLSTLLSAGADPNEQSAEAGRTPLMVAATFGFTEAVKLLLSAGAKPDLKDNEGRTALAFAKEKGHPEVVELLQQAGAKE